jgi:hypothetical protein
MFALTMTTPRLTNRALLLLCSSLLLAASLSALDRIGPLDAAGVPVAVKAAVEDRGYRVTLDGAGSADFWFARAVPTSPGSAAGALYPEFANGEFVAVVTFPKGTSDFRGQAVPPGTYTLRYQYIPQDANHMGVSPNPDFLLAIPVAADTAPADNLPLKRLVALSTKSTGTAHPAVFAMAPAGTPATAAKDDQGMMIFTAEIATASGKTEKIAIIVKGQATQ